MVDMLNQFELVVLDDLSAGLSSAFAIRTLFQLVDARSVSGRPLCVTTNFTRGEMLKTTDRQLLPLYDRILSLANVNVPVTGPSIRRQIAQEAAEAFTAFR